MGRAAVVESDHADDAGRFPGVHHDGPVTASIASGIEGTAALRIFDEREAVFGRDGLRHPGKPDAESAAILIDEFEDRSRMAGLQRLQAEVFVDFNRDHGRDEGHSAEYNAVPFFDFRPLLLCFGDPMIPVLVSNAIWLVICLIYAGLLFWQAGRDRRNGTGFVEED